jgi:hypothetical protein
MTTRSGGERASVLAQLMTVAQRRWGARALGRGLALPAGHPPLPTGVAPLDALLGGGLPAGGITEVLGRPTSGASTLALHVVAQAQARGQLVAVVDLAGRFHPAYAAACGVDLASLLLVRPASAADALALVAGLIDLALGLIVVPALAALHQTADGQRRLAQALPRWQRALAGAPTVVLALTYLPYPPPLVARLAGHGSALARAAPLRLHIARQGWSLHDPGTPQCHAQVTVLRRRGAPDQTTCPLTLALPIDCDAEGV